MSVSENVKCITQFYSCFNRQDWKGMLRCYHEDIVFYDPVFENLEGPQVRAMWEMLLTNAKGMEMSFSEAKSDDDDYGSCNWIATYTFSQTGRPVVNKGKALFAFREGKISEHQDRFDLWKWSRQALGTPGILLGWSPFLQHKIREKARKSLEKFMAAKTS